MRYSELKEFISKRMRMSHIYQPVMLMALLRNNGKCSTTQIAKAILKYDDAQIEYYEQITNNMVGKVLRNHGIVEKQGKDYILKDSERLAATQRDELIDLCQSRLSEYLDKRGEKIFAHRKLAAGYVSGTLRYEVLKAAKFCCELCGIPADEKALEVDHIVPRNHGGSDDPSNLQALCYSCNSMKRDRDTTDFRKVRESYGVRQKDCLFCEIPTRRIVASNELAYAVEDSYAVTPMHALIIPKRHVPAYFDLGRPEVNACNLLLEETRARVTKNDPTVEGFNIGMNCGEVAGQSIFHCHIHLIPRRRGDVQNPRGGVRHVIPGKGNY
jgi:diadenosine tetraphosphate (Ap4A) HIT family hydrolase/5-methylcytosine-specific restriction endonuclease McrA